MDRLHANVRRNQQVSEKLANAGFGADDVLAVERKNNDLVVYTY